MKDYFAERINFYFIRHGRSEANEKKVICGQIDSPLSSEGIKQAEDLRKTLLNEQFRWDKCFSSPLSRAVHTAKIVTNSKNIEVCDDLIEINAGDYSHLTTTELIKIDSVLHNHGLKPDLSYPNGESLNDLQYRTVRWLKRISNTLNKGDKVLIVAHWGSINIIMQHLLGIPIEQYSSFYLQNCHLSHITVNDTSLTGAQLHRFNFR